MVNLMLNEQLEHSEPNAIFALLAMISCRVKHLPSLLFSQLQKYSPTNTGDSD